MEKHEGIQEDNSLKSPLPKQNSDPAAAPESEKQPQKDIRILSWKSAGYSKVRIYGLTYTFYLILKSRLGCPGSCTSQRIEFCNTNSEDVVQVLVACGYSKGWISTRKR